MEGWTKTGIKVTNRGWMRKKREGCIKVHGAVETKTQQQPSAFRVQHTRFPVRG
jgi:hypothetical protein